MKAADRHADALAALCMERLFGQLESARPSLAFAIGAAWSLKGETAVALLESYAYLLGASSEALSKAKKARPHCGNHAGWRSDCEECRELEG